MRTKLTAIGSLAALLLVGAGCTQPDTAPDSAAQEEVQSEIAPAAGAERRATQPTIPTNRQATPVPTEVSDSDTEEPKTNPRLEKASQLFDVYRTRMAKATLAAAPKIDPLYDQPDWANYEPYAKAMYDEGVVASKALLDATNAFDGKEPGAEVIITKANTAMSLFLDKIQAFEAHWAVSGQ